VKDEIDKWTNNKNDLAIFPSGPSDNPSFDMFMSILITSLALLFPLFFCFSAVARFICHYCAK
jgi:hypothetical protein